MRKRETKKIDRYLVRSGNSCRELTFDIGRDNIDEATEIFRGIAYIHGKYPLAGWTRVDLIETDRGEERVLQFIELQTSKTLPSNAR